MFVPFRDMLKENIMKKLLTIFFLVAILASITFAQTQNEQLKQMVAQLQTTPKDDDLRARIIRLAATMKPAPAISEDANKAYVKGGVFKEEAKDASGYDLAVGAFREAVRIAPWWSDAYFNLGVTLGLAGKYDEAIASLKLSMASVPPDSKEARDTQNRIYAIEAKAEMASKQAATANAEAERAAQAAKAKVDKTLIVPGERIGPIRLGMNESQVIAAMGSPSDRFEYVSGKGGVTMSWGKIGVDIDRNEGTKVINIWGRGYATSSGLSSGSSMSDVKTEMGPGVFFRFSNGWERLCYSQGITFIFEQPPVVTKILVEKTNPC